MVTILKRMLRLKSKNSYFAIFNISKNCPYKICKTKNINKKISLVYVLEKNVVLFY